MYQNKLFMIKVGKTLQIDSEKRGKMLQNVG